MNIVTISVLIVIAFLIYFAFMVRNIIFGLILGMIFGGIGYAIADHYTTVEGWKLFWAILGFLSGIGSQTENPEESD